MNQERRDYIRSLWNPGYSDATNLRAKAGYILGDSDVPLEEQAAAVMHGVIPCHFERAKARVSLDVYASNWLASNSLGQSGWAIDRKLLDYIGEVYGIKPVRNRFMANGTTSYNRGVLQ